MGADSGSCVDVLQAASTIYIERLRVVDLKPIFVMLLAGFISQK
jgi:hypothetical protein